MSGNADRSLTYRIQLASNRTKQWYKLQLEEEKRRHQDNVQRPILADPSEERPLYERMGSLAVYRDGVLYLNAPELGGVVAIDTSGTPVPPTPESIWWVANFDTSGVDLSILNNNIILNSTNEINNNYMVRLFTYAEPASYFYNRDGTLLKDLNASTRTANLARYVDSLLTFTSKDGKSMNLLHFKGGYTGFFNSRTFNFTLASITPRIATTSSHTYTALFYNAFSNTPATTPLQILDISDNIVAQIRTDVSGGSSARFDSALIITDQNGNYITNASMRTRDLSDNNGGNSIAVRGINTFSDGSVILAGDFATNQIVFYNAADVSMEQLTVPVRKTFGSGNNRDIFIASFTTSGVLRYYNYIRTESTAPNANEYDSSVAVDSADNAYIVGTINNPISNTGPPLFQIIYNKLQFFAKNTSSLTPSSNVVYDTSGFAYGGNPSNNCNFSANNVFITKYNYNGDFQWFAPMGNANDLSGDVSYHVRTTSTGVVLSMIYNSIMTNPGERQMTIYNGHTIAQINTPGVVFRRLDLSGTPLSNNIIIKYNPDGTGAWVKQIQGNLYTAGPTSGSSITSIGSALPLVVDNSNNIYNVSSYEGSGSYPTVSIWDIVNTTGTRTKISATSDFEPVGNSNPYIVSFTDSGTLRWYAGLLPIGSGGGTFCFNTRTTSANELLILCIQETTMVLKIYNSSFQFLEQTISITNETNPHLVVYKIQSDGTEPGTTVKYIISNPAQITSDFNVRVNNGISVDASDNVYITGELNSVFPAIGQTLDLINQDGATVATITKRSANKYEYFTVKIPASFTQE
jgi:hypothetical protein